MKSSVHSLIPFLPFLLNHLQLPSSELDPILCNNHQLRNSTQFFSAELFFITTLHGPRGKHSLSIVGKAFLQRCFIATEVTQLLHVYSLPRKCTESLPRNKRLFWLHYSACPASCHNSVDLGPCRLLFIWHRARNCEHSNEPSGSVKIGVLLGYLRYC
jgi:hypothetical protein